MRRDLYSVRMSTAVLLVSFLLLAVATPGSSAAGDQPAEGSEAATEPQEERAQPKLPARHEGPLGLDSLLRPRPGGAASTAAKAQELLGGRNQTGWREAFALARGDVVDLEQRVAGLQEQLRTASSGEWSYTPVGAGTPSDPEVLKLRAALKRDRKSLGVAESRLRELEVEASLSGVPDGWREPAKSD